MMMVKIGGEDDSQHELEVAAPPPSFKKLIFSSFFGLDRVHNCPIQMLKTNPEGRLENK
jgi:hypothetical protein